MISMFFCVYQDYIYQYTGVLVAFTLVLSSNLCTEDFVLHRYEVLTCLANQLLHILTTHVLACFWV